MALMLAPYNSAMRLGMGFNSYTQMLCVNDVVRKPGGIPATEDDLQAARQIADDGAPATLENSKTSQALQPASGEVLTGTSGVIARTIKDGQKDVSQVVSWEASFIENSEDVLKKLDVSGSLAIKIDGLGGLTGKGAFVDSSDIKKADINYFIHVKVTNQRLIGDNVTEFCPIDYIEPGQFTEIYGDCFISGFIEGGEFDAIISVTTAKTEKKLNMSGELELKADFGAVKVEATARGSKNDESTLKNATTKIKVTWSGGGDIREDTIKEWTLQNLKDVAMQFPDAVAACPQRTSAILTKYTSLRSFHEQTKKGSPLDYENAGVYTAALYDAYTDYKMMWKQIQNMLIGLNQHELMLFFREASPSLKGYAERVQNAYKEKMTEYEKAIAAAAEKSKNSTTLVRGSKYRTVEKAIEKPLPCNAVVPYAADVFGLENASHDCRYEMIKIVREVDAVTRNPHVATDPTRTSQYLSPNVFKMLLPSTEKIKLPTMDEWKSHQQAFEDSKKSLDEKNKEIAEIKRKLEAALITPLKEENGAIYSALNAEEGDLHPKIQSSIQKMASKADRFRMQGSLSNTKTITTGATFFNDLEAMEPDFRPHELQLWIKSNQLTGIKVAYSNSKECVHGSTEGVPDHTLQLAADGSEGITELQVHLSKGKDEKPFVAGMAVATSKCSILSPSVENVEKTLEFSMVDQRQWSVRGFFGFVYEGRFESLGVVWARDDSTPATSRTQPPPARNLLGMGQALQEKTRKAMGGTRPDEHFYVGGFVKTGAAVTSTSSMSFSALDKITASSIITKVTFYGASNRLCGLRVEYTGGLVLEHGDVSSDKEVWNCDIKLPVVAAKLTVGRVASFSDKFVDSVQLVCGNKKGELPLWPLDVVTVRYLGAHSDEDKFELESELAEQAPKLGRANWNLRGFYGEASHGVISQLGLIWGCAP